MTASAWATYKRWRHHYVIITWSWRSNDLGYELVNITHYIILPETNTNTQLSLFFSWWRHKIISYDRLDLLSRWEIEEADRFILMCRNCHFWKCGMGDHLIHRSDLRRWRVWHLHQIRSASASALQIENGLKRKKFFLEGVWSFLGNFCLPQSRFGNRRWTFPNRSKSLPQSSERSKNRTKPNQEIIGQFPF